jgi:hypothetical protein
VLLRYHDMRSGSRIYGNKRGGAIPIEIAEKLLFAEPSSNMADDRESDDPPANVVQQQTLQDSLAKRHDKFNHIMCTVFTVSQSANQTTRLTSEFLIRFRNAVVSIATAGEIRQCNATTPALLERFYYELMPDVDRWIYLLDEALKTQVTLIQVAKQHSAGSLNREGARSMVSSRATLIKRVSMQRPSFMEVSAMDDIVHKQVNMFCWQFDESPTSVPESALKLFQDVEQYVHTFQFTHSMQQRHRAAEQANISDATTHRNIWHHTEQQDLTLRHNHQYNQSLLLTKSAERAS